MKRFRSVKILKLGDNNIKDRYDNIRIFGRNFIRLPKRTIKVYGNYEEDLIGKAYNFKIKDDYVICDIELNKAIVSKTLNPEINTYDSYASIHFIETSLATEAKDKSLRFNLKGTEEISSWKDRLMKV